MKSSRQAKLGEYFMAMEKDRHEHTAQKNKSEGGDKNTKPEQKSQQPKKVQQPPQPKKAQQPPQPKKAQQPTQPKQQQKQPQQVQLSVSASQNSSISAISSVLPQPSTPNLHFYLNQIPSRPSGDLIDKIHSKWWGNYTLLQSHHGFIQWLFPNSFQSRFNPHAQPLTPAEAAQFRASLEIANRYQKSYCMMLQFYGMKLKNKSTGQLARSRQPRYQQRYQKTLITSYHNHMRITRILSSLVMCGFGRYARQLSLFLGEEINGRTGALKELKRLGVYEREWREYSEWVEKETEMSLYFVGKK